MKVKITSVDYFVHAMAQMVSCQSVTRVLGSVSGQFIWDMW